MRPATLLTNTLERAPKAAAVECFERAVLRSVGVRDDFDDPVAEELIQEGCKLRDYAIAARLSGVQSAASSVDTGALLENVARRITGDESRYDLRHRALAGVVEVPSFATQQVVRLGMAGKLDARPHGAPALSSGYAFKAENVAVSPYANVFSFGRHSLINAEWDQLAAGTAELVGAAYRRERYELLTLLESNPTLSDGVALFSTERGNDLDVGAPSAQTLEAMMAALRSMSGTLREMAGENGEALELEPAIWAVPASKELLARQVLRETGMDATLRVFASTALTHSYLFPNAEQHPVLALVYLRGQQAPLTTVGKRRRGDDDWIVKTIFDVGAAAITPRAVRLQAL